jgi:hypothetical protein
MCNRWNREGRERVKEGSTKMDIQGGGASKVTVFTVEHQRYMHAVKAEEGRWSMGKLNVWILLIMRSHDNGR